MTADEHSTDTQRAFGASHAQSYADSTPRRVPGFADLHKMTCQLLAERVAANGHLLIIGAGGGLEIKALADQQPGWTFHGVDPSADMLEIAREIVNPHNDRVTLQQGYADDAPDGPFDGATCILTMHFVPRDQRLATLEHIRRRLARGAPFIVAHISFPQTEPERDQWITRHVLFGGTSPENLESAKQAIATKLTVLSPEQDENLLREAGFNDVTLFYAGLSFRGWVAYA